jgi:hypothetical protein
MSPANTTKRRIGFVIDEDQGDKDDKKSRGNRT